MAAAIVVVVGAIAAAVLGGDVVGGDSTGGEQSAVPIGSLRPARIGVEVAGKQQTRPVSTIGLSSLQQRTEPLSGLPGRNESRAGRPAAELPRPTSVFTVRTTTSEWTTTTTSTTMTTSAAETQAATTAVPTTLALPSWRLAEKLEFADGSLEGRPLPRNVKPSLSRAQANSKATAAATNHRGGGRLDPSNGITAVFGEYDAPTGEWLGKVESVETESRAVWFVVFSGLQSPRSSGVIVRSRDRGKVSTTISLVVTDLLVVIDDETGEVLVVSEYAS
jgi:hypothetical protein